MKLENIIRNTGASILHGDAGTEIASITSDSRKACPGSLFIAVKGCNADGHAYIQDAIAKGAAAVVDADRRGLALCADNFYGHPSRKLQLVGITGTNGKTTTTTLVGEIFEASGRKTSVVGNIGNPVVTASAGTAPDDWLITEVSSFQLETTADFRPVVSAILNLTPDHLNRHGTMENYGLTKARIAENQCPEDWLVINMDDPKAYELRKHTAAKIVPFSMKTEPEYGAFLDGTGIVIKDTEGGRHIVCDRSDVRIIGDHNIENILAAAAVCFFAGISIDVISETVKAFGGVEHRIEFCGAIDGVDYYNDSKGTNVDAAVIALKALGDRIILIAGGDGKGQDFTELAGHFKGAVKELILLGRDAGIIEESARAQGFTNIHRCKDMPECVRKAAELAEFGDRVLLSPACASWDMYDNFEQRGKHFKECLKEMLR